MPDSRSGTFDTSMSEPDLALRRHLRRARRQPGGAQVLQRGERAAIEQLQAALEQPALLERVADLHGRPLVGVVGVQLGAGEHRRPADPVAPGPRAEQHQPVADAGGRAADQPLGGRDAEAHRVDEAVLLVGALEVDLAAHGRHPDRVAVVADARRPRRRTGSASAASRARRSAASRARRSAARRPRTRRAGCPPTPVAAPWNGSTALGWLCDSTLNATASPSPTSTAPAFSPGPISTYGPSVGSVRSSFFECL